MSNPTTSMRMWLAALVIVVSWLMPVAMATADVASLSTGSDRAQRSLRRMLWEGTDPLFCFLASCSGPAKAPKLCPMASAFHEYDDICGERDLGARLMDPQAEELAGSDRVRRSSAFTRRRAPAWVLRDEFRVSKPHG